LRFLAFGRTRAYDERNRTLAVIENVLQTLQQLVQDVIAPDVRELKVRVRSLEKEMDVRFTAMQRDMDARFSSLEQKIELQFRTVLSAIAESRAQAELTNVKLLASLSERVAVLEVKSR
jgi:capsule polysaccharide export protein KpsE/RkpR